LVTGITVKGIVSNTAVTQECERVIGAMLADRGLKGKSLNGNEVTVVIQSGGQKRDCLGHFAQSAWAGESVHYENFLSGNVDCSKGGAHNAKYFKAVAEECGLIVTHGKEHGKPGKAWAYTEPSDEFKAWIDTVIKPNVELFNMARLQGAVEKKQSSSVTLTCKCLGGKEEPATLTMSRGAVQTRIDTDSLPTCPACNATFKPAGE
jgi:hypothetical protein